MSKTVQISMTQDSYDRLALSVWEAVEAGTYHPAIYSEVFMYDNKVKVVFLNPYKDNMMTRTLTLKTLVRAYLSLDESNATHCGGNHILYEPDACSGDTLLQQALFGEIIYG